MYSQTQILIVDDDETVRTCMVAVLTEAGYQVYSAADGYEALARVQQIGFGAIVVDWLMPKLDGCAFFDLYRRLPNQHAAVILCSGIPSAMAKMGGSEPNAFLQKPFGADDLRRCVHQCLAESGPAWSSAYPP